MPKPVELNDPIEDKQPVVPFQAALSNAQTKSMEKVDSVKDKNLPKINPQAIDLAENTNLAERNVSVQENPAPTIEEQEAFAAEVHRRIVSLDELTQSLFDNWNLLEARKNSTTDPYEKEAIQAQIDAIIDAYLITVCRGFDHIELEDIFKMRECIKSAVHERSKALKDTSYLITVIVTSVVAVGCAGFAFFPGGVLGLTGTTAKGIVGMGTAVSTGGNMTAGYMQSSIQARVGLHDYDRDFNMSVERDRIEARQKQASMSREIFESRRNKDSSRHQAWEQTTR